MSVLNLTGVCPSVNSTDHFVYFSSLSVSQGSNHLSLKLLNLLLQWNGHFFLSFCVQHVYCKLFRRFSCYRIRTALLKSKEKHCVVSRRCWCIFNLMAARLRMLTFCAVFIGVAPFFRDGAFWVNVILCHKTTISNKSILQRFYNLQQFILIFKKMIFSFAKYLPLPSLNSRLREINITGKNTRVL